MKINNIFKNNVLDWGLIETLPNFAILKTIPQTPKWHKEGCVWNHTKLVVENMINELSKRQVDASTDYYRLMVCAALCHDLGKATTTKWSEKKEDYTSYNHAYESDKIVRQLFYEEEVLFREKLCSLVRLHMDIRHVLDTEDSTIANLNKIFNSCYCSLEDLLLLNLCDTLGSINDFETKDNIFENIKRLEDLISDNITSKVEDKILHQLKHSESQITIYFMVGLPGSGKDTYIHNNLSQLPTICRDDIRKEIGLKGEKPMGNHKEEQLVTKIVEERIKELCEQKKSLIINNTNLKKKYRDNLKRLISKYNTEVVYIYVEASSVEINKERRNGQIDRTIIDNMFDKFDFPQPSEYDKLLIIRT